MERTLMLIKPDATKRNLVGKILSIVEDEGFKIVKIKSQKMSKSLAKEFYAVHRKKDFFKDLVDYMCSGLTVGVILERKNAINHLREIVGATDPKEAKEGTIRHLFGETFRRNSVHASDSKKSFLYEKKVFFKER
uniref:Nucleoside diphosphate kinase n=1 Tax=candidate division WOR-3 bacterium TaxID=2052148 RepID=A0A7C3J6G8_UNCW3